MAGAFIAASSCPAHAADAGSAASAEEMLLFELINAARKDPLGTAEAIGMNPKKILKDFSEIKDILTDGLPPFQFNDCLYVSAGDHTRDMFDKSYYAYESIDGRTVADRMRDAGYTPGVSGENLGLLYFNNYISPEKAVYQLFVNMYRDELDPAWTGQRNILSPDMKDIGICIESGLFNFNGFSGNVYISTCDFGAEISAYELELLALINQARSKPKLVAAAYGLDAAKIVKEFPGLADVFSKGAPAVLINANLHHAAKKHALDMLANEYYSSRSKDGRTPADRIRDAGYEAGWSDESRMLLSTCYTEMTPAETVPLVFRRMLLRSFGTQAKPDQSMFSAKAMEAGVGMANGESSELGEVCGTNVTLTVVDYAAPAAPGDPWLSGMVYHDENGNGLFDQGEGLPGVKVEIKDTGSALEKHLRTNGIGGFSTVLPAGRYRVLIIAGDTEPLKKWVTLGNANVWISVEAPLILN